MWQGPGSKQFQLRSLLPAEKPGSERERAHVRTRQSPPDSVGKRREMGKGRQVEGASTQQAEQNWGDREKETGRVHTGTGQEEGGRKEEKESWREEPKKKQRNRKIDRGENPFESEKRNRTTQNLARGLQPPPSSYLGFAVSS